MAPRLAAGIVLAGALALAPIQAEGVAWAEAPAAPAAAAHGAIVVALSDDAAPASRSLAREIYRDPALRPSIDDATARVLAGEPPGEGPNKAKLTEMAEIRTSVSHTRTDAASRRLLASLGAETGVELVVTVMMMEGDRPVAQVLRVKSASFERVELGATIETAADGARSFQWPGAATTLKGMIAPPPSITAAKSPALAPRTSPPPPPGQKDTKESTPFWKSPWFWGPLGVVAAAGITVFVLSKTTSSPGKVHVDGRVTP